MLLGVATTPFLPQLSRDRKGDFFELTLGAAVVVLDAEPPGKRSRPILNPKPKPYSGCWCSARFLIEDLARAGEELHVRSNPAAVLMP